MRSDKYLRKIEQASGDTPAVPDASQVYQSNPPLIPPRRNARNQYGAFKISGMGLEISEGAKELDWQEVGDYLFGVEKSLQWLIGDWLAFGEDVAWGDIPGIAERYGASAETLANYASISRHCKFSLRNENLSYSHHIAVALESWTDEQKVGWLQKAENEKWGYRRLRAEIAKAQLPAENAETLANNAQVETADSPADEYQEQEATELPAPIADKSNRKLMNDIWKKVETNTPLNGEDRGKIWLIRRWCDTLLAGLDRKK